MQPILETSGKFEPIGEMKNLNKDVIDKKIQAIWNKPPSTIITGIYKFQDNHTKWFLVKYKGFTKYFEEAYDFYVQLVSSLNYVNKKNWKWSKNLPFIYLGNSTFPLFKAYTVCLDGFYEESLSLSRVGLELLIKSFFCVCYPEDCFSTYNKPEKGKRNFNLTNFLETDLKLDWKFIYSLPSGSTHGKLYFTKILSQIHENKKHGLIGLRLTPDEKMASVCINYLTFLIWAHIYFLVTYFDEVAPKPEINILVKQEAQDFIDALGYVVKDMPNSFKQVGYDFEKLIKIVISAKMHEDWKKLI